MKIPALLFAACLALPAAGFSQAPVGPGSLKLGKLRPEVVNTPEYQITGGQTKRYKLGKWLEIEVDYDVKAEEIDELTFKFTALIERKLLTGEVTYVNILQGKDRYAVMYVSPKALDKLTGGKALTGASIENVWVEVARQGQVLDRAAFKNSAIPNLQQVPGLLLNKTQTPFAPLYYDRYEEIRPTR